LDKGSASREAIMGRSYLFECPKCGYKATVSGGEDEGLDCRVQTAHCRDCRKIFDAIIRLRVQRPASVRLKNPSELRLGKNSERPPAFEQVVHKLPLPTSKNYQWAEFDLQCPVSSSHKVQAWRDPGKCPICGVFLEQGGLPFRTWE
jgi:hypothetical protein